MLYGSTRWSAMRAIAVLTAPGVLLVAEPMRHSDRLIFVVPFAVTVLFAPAALYLSLLNL